MRALIDAHCEEYGRWLAVAYLGKCGSRNFRIVGRRRRQCDEDGGCDQLIGPNNQGFVLSSDLGLKV